MNGSEARAAVLGSPIVAFLARVTLTCPYWLSAASKLANWQGAIGEMQHFGLEPAAPLAAAVIALQLIGSLLIILGRWTWLAAAALAGFTAAATLIAHAFWTFPKSERFAQTNIFFEHVAIIGGLALAAILADGTRRA